MEPAISEDVVTGYLNGSIKMKKPKAAPACPPTFEEMMEQVEEGNLPYTSPNDLRDSNRNGPDGIRVGVWVPKGTEYRGFYAYKYVNGYFIPFSTVAYSKSILQDRYSNVQNARVINVPQKEVENAKPYRQRY